MDYSNKTNLKEVDMSDYNSFNDTKSSAISFDEDDSAKADRLLSLLYSVDFFGHSIGSGGDKSRASDPKDIHASERARKLAKDYIQNSREKAYSFWQIFEAAYGKHLELDGWADIVHYEGVATTRSKLMAKLEKALQMSSPQASKGFYERQLEQMLEGRKFQPVQKYLTKVYKEYSEKKVWTNHLGFEEQERINTEKGVSRFAPFYIESDLQPLPEWDNLGKVLFGTDDPLTQEMITSWLCGAVQRAITPGCLMKRSLILKGDQDAGKSAFTRILAKSWGTELRAGTSEADIIRLCKFTWIMELSECDRLFKGKEASVLKSLLSTTKDTYIQKYKEADEASVTERVTLFIGTTNESKFLVDTTGNKRFWVVDLADGWKLPLSWLEDNVDQLWATAYHKLLNGHSTDLSEDSQVASEVRNREYMIEGSWVEQLERVLEVATKEGNREIAFKVVDIQLAMGTHADNQGKNKTAVINSLKQLGYDQRPIKVGGKTERVYALKTTEKPIMAKFVGTGEWCYWSTKLGGWQSNQDVTVEVRKEARGQA
ncbi:MAG: VapE family protein [Nostoc sp. DedQUE12b]|uniref:VapE domain-containing protein n=1 Tax=Nostoc sp. DedQUE12b TaxID=3075398 RepID=UPI002AD33B67|nr:VapE domain-containing protein [Nostoc sp. DedQUE12b]MDZ8089480.1 VapE family protein [Nostoc sp. DedQUE12b]